MQQFSKSIKSIKSIIDVICVSGMIVGVAVGILFGFVAKAEQPTNRFVSLTLCADRLLGEIAQPQQIAALSTFSVQNYTMLRVNRDKPTVRPRLSELIPYADTTILLNKHFYPHLYQRLHSLGFNILSIKGSPQNAEDLFVLIRQLGELTQNTARADTLITKLKNTTKQLQERFAERPSRTAMILADSGVIDLSQAQYRQLFALLKLTPTPVRMGLNISPEQLLLANPEVLITQRTHADYNDGARWLTHPVLSAWAQSTTASRALLHADNKYFFCFDHGIWQGATRLAEQLPP